MGLILADHLLGRKAQSVHSCTYSVSLSVVLTDAAYRPVSTAAVASSRPRWHPEGGLRSSRTERTNREGGILHNFTSK
jgi:hypothetical protein